MKLRAFEVPGMPLLQDMVAPIAIQNEGYEKLHGPLICHIGCRIPVPSMESPGRKLQMMAGKVFPVEGPDVLAVGIRTIQALVTAGVIEDGRQIVDVTISKEYGLPGVDVGVMERN